MAAKNPQWRTNASEPVGRMIFGGGGGQVETGMQVVELNLVPCIGTQNRLSIETPNAPGVFIPMSFGESRAGEGVYVFAIAFRMMLDGSDIGGEETPNPKAPAPKTSHALSQPFKAQTLQHPLSSTPPPLG